MSEDTYNIKMYTCRWDWLRWLFKGIGKKDEGTLSWWQSKVYVPLKFSTDLTQAPILFMTSKDEDKQISESLRDYINKGVKR